MTKIKKLCSDSLFARPSFLEGIARMFDFGNTLNEYNDSPSGDEADAKAIRSDWQVVGLDIKKACTKFEKQSGMN